MLNAYELAELRVLLTQAGYGDWTVREQSAETVVVHDGKPSFAMYISEDRAPGKPPFTAWDGTRYYDRRTRAEAMRAALYREPPWESMRWPRP